MSFNRNKSLAKAQKFLQKGKIEDAIAAYQEVVQDDPSDVRTLLKIGDLQSKISDIKNACLMYQKVGEHYAKDGFYLKAVAVYKQILKLDPGLLNIYLKLAELYQHLGLANEAMKQYQIVVRQYESLGLIRESLDILKKISDLEPDNTTSKIKLAELYLKEGHKQDSEAQFLLLTQKLKASANYTELSRVYERMIAVGISSLDTELGLAEAYLEQGDARHALVQLQKLFQREPRNIRILEVLATCFTDLDQKEKAKSVYTEILSILDQENRSSEKEKFSAKLRALNVLVHNSHEVTLDLYEPEDKTQPKGNLPGVVEDGSGPKKSGVYKKLLDDVDIFLQYGLLTKAQEVLEGVIRDDGGTADSRAKYVDLCQNLGEQNKIVLIYNHIQYLRNIRDDEKMLSTIQAEMLKLGLVSDIQAAAPEPTMDADLTVDTSSLDSFEIIDDTDTSIIPELAVEEPNTMEQPDQVTGEVPVWTQSPFADMSAEQLPNDLQENTERRDAISPEMEVSIDTSDFAAEIPFFPNEDTTASVPTLEVPEVAAPPAPAPVAAAPVLDPKQQRLADFESQMETANFLLSRGLKKEAHEIFLSIVMKDRTFEPAVVALENMARMDAPPPTPVVSAPVVPVTVPEVPKMVAPPVVAEESSSFFDPTSELESEIKDLEKELGVSSSFEEEEAYLSPEEVISEFKKGIAKTVAKDDFQTHYNLGIAYKEMGLLDEAVSEFSIAKQDKELEADCVSMIGLTLMQKKEIVPAIKVYKEALVKMTAASKGYLGLMYELAEAYYQLDKLDDAVKCYLKVAELDPTFRECKKLASEIETKLARGQSAKTSAEVSMPPMPLQQPTPFQSVEAPAAKQQPKAEEPIAENESLEKRSKRNKVSFI